MRAADEQAVPRDEVERDRSGRFVDARSLPSGSVIECDVCIVGSGAAGTTVALELQGRGLRVCVLESGGGGPDPTTTSLNELEVAGPPIGPESRQRFLGGTTNSWYGGLAPLHGIDFEERRWLGITGWPLREEELAPFYRRACELFAVPDLTVDQAVDAGRRRGLEITDPDLAPARVYWPSSPVRFAEILRRVAARPSDLRVYLHANLVDLRLDDLGTRVDELVVRTLAGGGFLVRPAAIVLACGGIENARILLSTGTTDRAPLGNRFDQVGRHFMDHPKGECGVVSLRHDAPTLARAYWSWRKDRFRWGLRLADAVQRREHALNSYVAIQPRFHGPGIDVLRRIRRGSTSAALEPRAWRAVASDLPGLASFAGVRLLNRGHPGTLQIENFMEQEPRSGNRVRLSGRRDALGMPLARVEWSISDRERRTMRLLHEALDRTVRRLGIGRVHSPLITGEEGWTISRDASHHLGTTRMGTDEESSVVDPTCRLHDVRNVWVAGSSVFPSGGYANPTLTIVALSIRLADHLKHEVFR